MNKVFLNYDSCYILSLSEDFILKLKQENIAAYYILKSKIRLVVEEIQNNQKINYK
jgi:hypothetical protein